MEFKCTHNTQKPTVGRAVTATFVPIREDLELAMMRQAKSQGMKGMYNQWVVDGLVEDDVFVADLFDKTEYGTLVGGNLATVIRQKTKRGGAVVWGSIRDLQQIREIRLSERKFYQKVTDLYATAFDYDKDAKTTRQFFRTVQNKMHFAVHRHTAAELIVERADASKEHMGLTTWENAPEGKILKADVTVAKKLPQYRGNALSGAHCVAVSGLCRAAGRA